MADNKVDEVTEKLRKELGEIEMGVITKGITIMDLMEEGTRVTGMSVGWSGGGAVAEECDTKFNVCALGAAVISAKARGIL
jgi:hypothetical protein